MVQCTYQFDAISEGNVPTYYTYINSPLQPLLIVSDGSALTGLYLDQQRYAPAVASDWVQEARAEPFGLAQTQLSAYFARELQEFDFPLMLHGTPFQLEVWRALLEVPYGSTTTYSELAHQIGRPRSVRAVGQANARNPISIIVPCHRVISSNGKLTGYGGGLDRKAALLALEGVMLQMENNR
jgi:methylated-DNA-[protein]-cysteine S-methyltransferase